MCQPALLALENTAWIKVWDSEKYKDWLRREMSECMSHERAACWYLQDQSLSHEGISYRTEWLLGRSAQDEHFPWEVRSNISEPTALLLSVLWPLIWDKRKCEQLLTSQACESASSCKGLKWVWEKYIAWDIAVPIAVSKLVHQTGKQIIKPNALFNSTFIVKDSFFLYQ